MCIEAALRCAGLYRIRALLGCPRTGVSALRNADTPVRSTAPGTAFAARLYVQHSPRSNAMDQFNPDKLQELVTPRDGPCATVFAATRRGGAQEDPIRIKEQLKDVEQQLLGRGMPATDARAVVNEARRV